METKETIKLSVIIPVFNDQPYLSQCLDSVCRQTLDSLEIICVDDGSEDQSLSILKAHASKDSRIQVLSQSHAGFGIAINSAIEIASGEYIAIMEGNGAAPLSMYEDLYRTAKEQNLDLVQTDFYDFTTDPETGSMHLVYKAADESGRYYNRLFSPSDDPDSLHCRSNGTSGIYRKAFLNEYNIRCAETPTGSFWEHAFFFRVYLHAKRAILLPKPYYMHRSDNPVFGETLRDNVYSMNIEYDRLQECLRTEPDIWDKYKYMYTFKKIEGYLLALDCIDEASRKEYVQRISRECKRAADKAELDVGVFPPRSVEKLRFLMKDPNGYVMKYCRSDSDVQLLEEKLKKAEKKLRDIKGSTTYRVGRLVMYLPLKLKKLLKKLLHS